MSQITTPAKTNSTTEKPNGEKPGATAAKDVAKKNGATSSKTPRFLVAPEVVVRRSYSLSEATATLIDAYADFLTDYTRSKVTAGAVVEKIAAKLATDPAFVEWKQRPKSGASDKPQDAKKDA
jgi:hypothetical protein